MADFITIYVTLTWQDVDPTGDKCYVCGDCCYLREVKLFVDKCELEGSSLCSSCADIVMESEE